MPDREIRPEASSDHTGVIKRIATFAAPIGLLIGLAVAVWLPDELKLPARLALFAFGAATVLWIATALPAAYVAFGASLFLVLSRAISEDKLFAALDSDVVWLLIGTFIISAAVTETGLAERLGAAVARGGTTVGGMCWRLTAGVIPLAFVIPSTSGRAAILLPLFRKVSDCADDRRVARALALLIPAVIVISTGGSLVGAGSHLVANDILHRASGDRIGFGLWALYGLPFAVVMSAATCWVIQHMFLDGDLRRRELVLETDAPPRMTGPEWRTITVTAAMIALWVTEGLHPFGIALVALLGGFVLTTPKVGVIRWKKGIKSVKWNLILFVGAALVLSGALVDTGAADWLIRRMIDFSGLSSAEAPIVVLAALLAMSLTAHLYFTSHTARVAALLPPLLVLARSLDLQAPAVAFIVTVGMDYCLTFPVSSKALLLFGGAEDAAWTPKDLLKLTAVLLPLYALLMVAFYYGYWRPLGLSL